MQGYDSWRCARTWSSAAPTQNFNLLVGRALQAEYGQEPHAS